MILTALLLLQLSPAVHQAALPVIRGGTRSHDGISGSSAPHLPIPACLDGPFVVYFDWGSDHVGPQAQAVLDDAVSDYQICRQAQVLVAGHTDRSGSGQYDVGLAQRRAANVRAHLDRRGVPDSVITSVVTSECRPQVETADGVREPPNPRVEITFGPGSGW
jgi:OOP family OmpA-OmpF porin